MEGRLHVFHSRMHSADKTSTQQLRLADGGDRAIAHRSGRRERNHDRVAVLTGCDGGPGIHDGVLC